MSLPNTSEAIFSVVTLYRTALRSKLKASFPDLNGGQVKCISFISMRGTCTANDMVNSFGLDKAQIARLVKEMVEKNWLIRTANPKDKRSQLLSLTESGMEIAALFTKTQEKLHKQMHSNISEQELREFERVAGMIANNLKNH
jgi:DNA-binding MarR family transcriptional regulator